MRKIKLSDGILYTLVDNSDYKILSKFNWHIDGKGYVSTRDITGKYVAMHRFILFGESKSDLDVDHINHNTLDNRKSNLRPCTRSQNLWNRNKFKNNKSGYKGVYLNKSRNKWTAQIRVNGVKHYLGEFENIQDAVNARTQAEITYHKEFRRTH